jgi:hypothetical protein
MSEDVELTDEDLSSIDTDSYYSEEELGSDDEELNLDFLDEEDEDNLN